MIKNAITKEQRAEYIKNFCVVKTEPCQWDKNKDWITILSKDKKCYLTAAFSLDKIENEASVLDLLILHNINFVDSIYESSNVACIGFSETEQKWYGWSHRACWGFGIGSEVKKGDCAYVPTDREDFKADAIRFWTEESHINVHIENENEQDFDVVWTISDNPVLVPNPKARGGNGSHHYVFPKGYGKGEWIAQTLDDAKQMAIDFAESVS